MCQTKKRRYSRNDGKAGRLHSGAGASAVHPVARRRLVAQDIPLGTVPLRFLPLGHTTLQPGIAAVTALEEQVPGIPQNRRLTTVVDAAGGGSGGGQVAAAWRCCSALVI